MNQLAQSAPAKLARVGDSFDTAILAGTKSPKTIEVYTGYFREYLNFVGGNLNEATTYTTLAAWRRHLWDAGYTDRRGNQRNYSVSAINQRLAAVRSVMAEAAEQGYISAMAAIEFKSVRSLSPQSNKGRTQKNSKTRITKEQMIEICNAPDTLTAVGLMHRALLLTLASTGIRATELVSVRVGDIEWYTDEDGRSGYIVLVAGKNKVEPTARAMATKAKTAIDLWLSERSKLGVESEYIFTGFTGRGGRGPRGTPLSRQAAWEIAKAYAVAAGINGVKPHDFRRYVGTQLAKVSIRTAQKQLGHQSASTTAAHYVMDGAEVGTTEDLV